MRKGTGVWDCKAHRHIWGSERTAYRGVHEDEVLVPLQLDLARAQKPSKCAPVIAFVQVVDVSCIARQGRQVGIVIARLHIRQPSDNSFNSL